MRAATKDAVLASAVDLAREAAVEVAGSTELVGEHLGLVVEAERLVSHRFASLLPGYGGWTWTVTVARVPRSRRPTVSEVELLPGDDAILAPVWVPWAERLKPGDIGPGDVLPYRPDDDRLDQGYEATGDEDADRLAIWELGLGRARVLSRQGRAEAADRWYSGTRGPTAPQAVAASAACSTCAFLLPLAGSLRTVFGVCANEWSPDDGRVVSMDHGCGAHSETDVDRGPSDWPAATSPSHDPDLKIERVVPPSDEADAAPAENVAPAEEVAPAGGVAPVEGVAPAEDAVSAEDVAPGEDVAPTADEAAPAEPAPDAPASDAAAAEAAAPDAPAPDAPAPDAPAPDEPVPGEE